MKIGYYFLFWKSDLSYTIYPGFLKYSARNMARSTSALHRVNDENSMISDNESNQSSKLHVLTMI
jgi:hypothetical protein